MRESLQDASRCANIPGSAFAAEGKKTDRLSQTTYAELPVRFQKIARDLQRRGEIVIETG